MTYGFPGVDPYETYADEWDGGLWGFDDDLGDLGDPLQDKLAQVDATFSRAYGIEGARLRAALEQMGPKLDAAITLFRAKPYSSEAKQARDAAYAIQYDIRRSELQGSAPAPDWLVDQIRDRVKAFLVAGTIASQPGIVDAAWDVFGPMTPEKAKFIAEQAGKGAKAAGDLTWSVIPTWVKVVGGSVLALGLIGAVVALVKAAPLARGYVERQTGIRGLGVIHKTKAGKTVVCFKGRRSRRSRRERVCFPAKDKRQ